MELSTCGYIVPHEYEIYHIGPGDKKNTTKQHTKAKVINSRSALALWSPFPRHS